MFQHYRRILTHYCQGFILCVLYASCHLQDHSVPEIGKLLTDYFLVRFFLLHINSFLVIKTRFPVTACFIFRQHMTIWNEHVGSNFKFPTQIVCLSASYGVEGEARKQMQLTQQFYFSQEDLIGFLREYTWNTLLLLECEKEKQGAF